MHLFSSFNAVPPALRIWQNVCHRTQWAAFQGFFSDWFSCALTCLINWPWTLEHQTLAKSIFGFLIILTGFGCWIGFWTVFGFIYRFVWTLCPCFPACCLWPRFGTSFWTTDPVAMSYSCSVSTLSLVTRFFWFNQGPAQNSLILGLDSGLDQSPVSVCNCYSALTCPLLPFSVYLHTALLCSVLWQCLTPKTPSPFLPLCNRYYSRSSRPWRHSTTTIPASLHSSPDPVHPYPFPLIINTLPFSIDPHRTPSHKGSLIVCNNSGQPYRDMSANIGSPSKTSATF